MRPSATARTACSVAVDGAAPAADAKVFAAEDEVYVLRHGRQTRVRLKDFSPATAEAGAGDGVIKAPMHGKVLELFAGAGDAGRRRSTSCRDRSDEDGTYAARAVCRHRGRGSRCVAGAQVVEGAQIMVIERLAEAII